MPLLPAGTTFQCTDPSLADSPPLRQGRMQA